MLGIDLVDGSLIFAGFIVFMLFAFTYATYTRTGNGIDFHPFGDHHDPATGARKTQSAISGRDGIAHLTSRGTR